MKGCTANAEVRHRFNQSGDADAACDLSHNFGPLRHFSDYIGRESGLMATANQFIVQNRISRGAAAISRVRFLVVQNGFLTGRLTDDPAAEPGRFPICKAYD
jgi:hypothetical protein